MERGCGSSPAARSTSPRPATTSSTTSSAKSFLVVRVDDGHDQGLPATPASTAAASSRSTTGGAARSAARSTASPGTSTAAEARPRGAGTSPTSTPETFALPEVQVGTGRASCSSTPTPTPVPLEEFSARSPSTSSAGTRTATWRRTWPRSSRPTGRSPRRRSARRTTSNATHPRRSPYLGDMNSQVDIWDTFSRVITPGGTPSPLLGWSADEERCCAAMLDVRVDEELPVTLEEGQTARVGGRRARANAGGRSSATWSTSGATPR